MDSQNTRSLLNNFIEDCFQKIQNYLYDYTKIELKETLNKFKALNNSITIPVESLKEYSELIKNHYTVCQEEYTIEEKKNNIEKMFKILKSVSYHIMKNELTDFDTTM